MDFKEVMLSNGTAILLREETASVIREAMGSGLKRAVWATFRVRGKGNVVTEHRAYVSIAHVVWVQE